MKGLGMIVLSCFEPMGGWMKNSSQLLVHSLRDDLPEELTIYSHSFSFRDVPADTEMVAASVDSFFQDSIPELCIMFGQSRRNRLAIERIAINSLHFSHADAKGNVRSHQQVVAGGPGGYLSNIPELEELSQGLCNQGVPAYVSDVCGTSLCNQIYYHCLRKVQEEGLKTKVLFVHVPVLPEQVIEKWPDAPCLPLNLLRKGASTLVQQILSKSEQASG